MQYGILVYQTGQDEHKIDVPVSLLSRSERTVIALQRPSSVGIGPAIFVIERFSADGLLVYQTGLDEHKIDVPVSWLPPRYSSFIALQRPSSVGIRPAIFQIERFLADGLLVHQSAIKCVFRTHRSADDGRGQGASTRRAAQSGSGRRLRSKVVLSSRLWPVPTLKAMIADQRRTRFKIATREVSRSIAYQRLGLRLPIAPSAS